MAEDGPESLSDRMREFVDGVDGLTLVGEEEAKRIADSATSRHLTGEETVRGIPGIWRYESDGRGDLLEVLTAQCEGEVVMIPWRHGRVEGVRGRCPEVCRLVDEFEEIRFLVVGPEDRWIIADVGGRWAVSGSFRPEPGSIPRHLLWSVLIGLVVGSTALGAAWVEYGYRAPGEPLTLWAFLGNEYAQDALLVGAFAGVMASCLSFFLMRRSRPSMVPRQAQLAVGILVVIVASLGIALLLAMLYDFHLQAQKSGH